MNKTRAILDSKEVYMMAKSLCKLHRRFGLMWLLGVYTGLRIGDLLRLRPLDISEILWIEEQKTKRIRGIYLPTDILADIEFHVKESGLLVGEYLFFSSSRRKNKPISRQWAHRIIARTAKTRGLRHIGAHSMRKIYACELYRSTGKIEAVQRSLGHKSVATTFFYVCDVIGSA